MQSPTNVITDVVRSPATVIAALAIFVRWVAAPAVTNFMRRELQSELTQLGQFPLYVERVKAIEVALERLSGVAESLARIEEQLNVLHEERRNGAERRLNGGGKDG